MRTVNDLLQRSSGTSDPTAVNFSFCSASCGRSCLLLLDVVVSRSASGLGDRLLLTFTGKQREFSGLGKEDADQKQKIDAFIYMFSSGSGGGGQPRAGGGRGV